MSSMIPRREGGETVSLRDALDRMFQESFVRPWITRAIALNEGVRRCAISVASIR